MDYSVIELPNFDINDTEAVITEIYVDNKQKITVGQKLFSAENTKAVNIITAEEEGCILIACKKFETRKTGDKLAYVFQSIAELEQFEKEHAELEEKKEQKVNATKKALELAADLGVDISDIAKHLKDNVIKVKDVQDFYDVHHTGKEKASSCSHVFKYDRERVAIVGAGNGAEVVIDILSDDFEKEVVGFIDDNVMEMANYHYKKFACGILEFPDKIDRKEYDTVIISIGATLKSMIFRKKVFDLYRNEGIQFTNAIAKSADIRRGVKIGVGNLIGAQSYIGTLTEIGDNNSISYGTFIGHHNVIGSHNLIAPGFASSGAVEIGSSCIIPAGVVTRNCIRIGDRVILPVGYTVVNSMEDDTVVQQMLCNGSGKYDDGWDS